MSDKKSTLLNEATIRRMMKLAHVDALTDSFISDKYTPLVETTVEEDAVEEDKAYSAKKEKPGRDKRKGASKRGAEGTLAKTKGHGRVDYIKEDDAEDDDWGGNKGDESETDPGAIDYEGDPADDLDGEIDADEAPAEEGEVTISDEEAGDIIALADKLRAAMGGAEPEAEEEVDIEAELDIGPSDELGAEEVDIEEEPAMRYEETNDDLYEAALSGLNIDVVDNDKHKQHQHENLKKKVYQKVVSRLLRASKK